MEIISVTKVKDKSQWEVRIGKTKVGKIILKNSVYQYFPRSSKIGGETFKSLSECIKSLQD